MIKKEEKMSKNNLLLLLSLLCMVNLFGFFDTEFVELNLLSHEWQQAGYNNNESDIPEPDEIILANTSNIISQIQYAINNASSINIIQVRLEPGEYFMDQPIQLDSYIILAGNPMFERDTDLWERTILKFNLSNSTDNCIIFNGITNAGVEDVWIQRIDEGIGNEIGQEGHNICFDNAEDCWVIGVESQNPVKHHIDISESNNIEIFGCYFHHAQFNGEGGFGYGVIIENNSHHCLVENNVFRKCRHAMLVQNAAHYNVFGYNYAREARQSNNNWLYSIFPEDLSGDIVCHGEPSYEHSAPNGWRGPEKNLFEGNICGWIWVDSFHLFNKKFNTFFRNRTTNYGFAIFPKIPEIFGYESEAQLKQNTIYNFMKNNIWCPKILFGNYLHNLLSPRSFSGADDPFEKHNRVKRLNFWGQYYTRSWTDGKYKKSCNTAKNDYSYYLAEEPVWLPIGDTYPYWPFDPDDDSKNPAKNRWKIGTRMTVSRYGQGIADVIYWEGNLTIDETYANDNDIPGWETFFLYPWQALKITSGSTITFTAECKVRSYGLMIIEPNVTIIFEQDVDFELYGVLNAVEVQFNGAGLEIYDTDLNYWQPIPGTSFTWAINSERYSYLENCTFENCNYSITSDNNGGALRIKNYANLTVENCTFENNSANKGGAIYNQNSNIKIIDCIFTNNCSFDGAAIYSLDSDIFLQKNRFISNQAENNGGAILIEGYNINSSGASIVSTNFFNQNSASFGGAMYSQSTYYSYFNKLLVINNSFINNHAGSDDQNYGFSIFHNDPSGAGYVNNLMWNDDYTQGASYRT